MRLDKFLKESRIIKRRTVSKEAILNGAIKLNGLEPKPGTEVKVGDVISFQTPRQLMEFEVVGLDKESGYVRSK
ncbi:MULTISPECIES: S4 domain-containing protein [Ezakiella]|uniref:S4 domain-containing protein n=1 Tax=Ezakiella TaxID=1582879 RepID=UPI00094E768B|nr:MULTISPECIES: S4 domain-containing protein [Ezakiella]